MKIYLGECSSKVTRPNGERSEILVSNPEINTVQLRKLSTFLTCISVLKPVNPCSCFGRAINDFGKLFSARPYKFTLETKIVRFAPKINFNCELLWFFTPLPLTLLQSTSLVAVLNFHPIQSTYS